jgi:hypothetical protein
MSESSLRGFGTAWRIGTNAGVPWRNKSGKYMYLLGLLLAESAHISAAAASSGR